MPLPADQLFRFASTGVLLGWVALALSPLARPQALSAARWVAAVVCGLYVTLLVRSLLVGPGVPPGADLMTLDGIARLFTSRQAVLAGWVHYLAFDLWVGSWEAEDASRAGVPHWLLLPCLALTFLAGPLGLLAYLLARVAHRRGRRA